MKWILWVLIFLAFVTPLIFIGKGIDHLDVMKDRYKRAIDAGADAAVKHHSYDMHAAMQQTSLGYGEGTQDRSNIAIDKDKALFWFYEVLYRNLGINRDDEKKLYIKNYIPMKAIASFDRLMIADADDVWIIDEYYDIELNGIIYRFTLSDKVMDLSAGVWKRDIDYGISPEKRRKLVSGFIKDKLNIFLNNRDNFESGYYYDINISVSDKDSKSQSVEGISFMVLIEGLPLPSLNPWKKEEFYAFSLGGSELTR